MPLAGDPDSAETRDWVKRQNEFTARYLESLPDRPWFLETMQLVMRQPRAGVPFKRADHYFVSRNDGSQNQDVIFVGSSLQELLAGGRVLVDPQHLLARRYELVDDLYGERGRSARGVRSQRSRR